MAKLNAATMRVSSRSWRPTRVRVAAKGRVKTSRRYERAWRQSGAAADVSKDNGVIFTVLIDEIYDELDGSS